MLESSWPSPSLGGSQSDLWGISGPECSPEVHGMSPPLFSVPLSEQATQYDDNVFLSEDPVKRQQKPRISRMTSLLLILRRLQCFKFTVLDLLSCIIDGQGEFEGFCNALFSPKNRGALTRLFNKLYQDTKGHAIFSNWMFPNAVTLVQEKIHTEMEAARPYLQMHTSEVTPTFIEEWDIHRIMEPVTRKITPTLTRIIESAGESNASQAKSKSTKSKNKAMVTTMTCLHLNDSQLRNLSGITYYYGTASLSAFDVLSKGPCWSWSSGLGFWDFATNDQCLAPILPLCIIS